ncbi:MAG: TetR/AcrR family transcriptional regulator [Clostridiales bacterium]|jgi:AcrR family transcriptional regulator|nr:TetR/AcrR family transcriptional regulator [Clostridiales bacterium]
MGVNDINATFENLSEEKRNSIINAAFSCFGKTGYKKTSTSDIAKAVGIPKSSLFKYFGTKRGMYLYLFQFACDAVAMEVVEGPEDFFECIKLATDIKVRVAARFPGMFDFMISTLEEKGTDIYDDLKAINDKRVDKGLDVIFKNVDWGKFKPGVDRSVALNAVTWINEGYGRGKKEKDIKTICADLEMYMNLLKQSFYKEEYLK